MNHGRRRARPGEPASAASSGGPRFDRAAWDALLAYLREHHVTVCRRWFDELEPIGVDRGALAVRVHQTARRQYLDRECAAHFAEAAQAVSGMLLTVRFVGPADEAAAPHSHAEHTPPSEHPPIAAVNGVHASPAPASAPVAAAPAQTPAPLPAPRPRSSDQIVLSPDYTFDTFVPGPENRLAHAAAVAVSENPGAAYNPVFIHGDVGLGKTHLLQAICHRLLELNPAIIIHYVSCDTFITQFMESVQHGQMAGFRHRFRDVDVLVIDDIHFLTQRERTQEEFFHTFNALTQAQKQIVLSSDAPPDLIPHLEARLVSRFKSGLVAEVEKPTYETRVAIVKKKSELRGLDMPDDVACLIAGRIDSNIRELEGAIVRVQMHASLEKKPIDRALAESVLGPVTSRPSSQLAIQTIIETVSDFYNVKLSDLQGKRRQKSIAHPRQVCMYLARRLTNHSLEEVGGFFGGRDHTTVMHAVRTVTDRAGQDADFQGVLKSLEQRLTGRR